MADNSDVAHVPVLVWMYKLLARRESDARAEFGIANDNYAAKTPAFLPCRHETRIEAHHSPRTAHQST